MTNKKLDVSKL